MVAKSRSSSEQRSTTPRSPRVRKQRASDAPLLLPELDRLIHERLRLGIMSALAINAALSFHELKEALGTTDGNLSVHARKLEEAGYVVCEKSFKNRLPRTVYSLSDAGRQALTAYLGDMEALIRATRDA